MALFLFWLSPAWNIIVDGIPRNETQPTVLWTLIVQAANPVRKAVVVAGNQLLRFPQWLFSKPARPAAPAPAPPAATPAAEPAAASSAMPAPAQPAATTAGTAPVSPESALPKDDKVTDDEIRALRPALRNKLDELAYASLLRLLPEEEFRGAKTRGEINLIIQRIINEKLQAERKVEQFQGVSDLFAARGEQHLRSKGNNQPMLRMATGTLLSETHVEAFFTNFAIQKNAAIRLEAAETELAVLKKKLAEHEKSEKEKKQGGRKAA